MTEKKRIVQAAAARRALLMPHSARQRLIHQPCSVRYILPVERYAGVQLLNDEDWIRDANAWKKKYAQDINDTEALL